MGTLTYLGSVTIGVAIPLLALASLQINAAIGPLLAELNLRLGAYTALLAKIGIKPPSLTGSIEVVGKILAGLNAAVGLSPPSVDFAASAVLGLMATVKAQIASVQLAVDLAAQIDGLAAQGGVKLFLYEGPLSELGVTLDAQVSGDAGIAVDVPIYVPILVVEASNTGTTTALGKVLKVS